jgi:hypothetical protein
LDPPTPDEVQRLVDILELLHPQLRPGGIAAEGVVAEDLEEMYEYYLGGVSTSMRGRDAMLRAMRGTYAVREVGDEVLDGDFPDLELAVQPAVVWSVGP